MVFLLSTYSFIVFVGHYGFGVNTGFAKTAYLFYLYLQGLNGCKPSSRHTFHLHLRTSFTAYGKVFPSESRSFPHTRALLPVSELVHGHGQMRGELLVAGVEIVVIFGQQVDVVQEDTAPVLVSEGLPNADVQQLRPVKSAVPPLKQQRACQGNKTSLKAALIYRSASIS